jgi:ketosteroid isomerase-like protein
MTTNAIESLVRELSDKEAIRDLARRYAHCVWKDDADGAIGLFAEDGQMEIRGRAITGREALLDAYRSMLVGLDLQPFVHNHVIELAGDHATGTCYLDLRATMDGKSMLGSGWYDDRYVRTAKGWKFASRALTMKFLAPVQEGWSRKPE